MIKKVSGGYKVLSENGKKNLGGPYKSKAAPEKRLKQVEYFKRKGWIGTAPPQRQKGRATTRLSRPFLLSFLVG
jgi:hypothetical protein